MDKNKYDMHNSVISLGGYLYIIALVAVCGAEINNEGKTVSFIYKNLLIFVDKHAF